MSTEILSSLFLSKIKRSASEEVKVPEVPQYRSTSPQANIEAGSSDEEIPLQQALKDSVKIRIPPAKRRKIYVISDGDSSDDVCIQTPPLFRSRAHSKKQGPLANQDRTLAAEDQGMANMVDVRAAIFRLTAKFYNKFDI